MRSASSDRDGIPVTENLRKRSDDEDCSWSPIKRRCRSDGQHNSSEKARNLTSGSSAGDIVADVALKAPPKFRRMKANNLQLKVIKLGNEKCDIKRKSVSKQLSKSFKKSEEVSDAGQKVTKSDDLLRLHVALLSDDVSSNESAEEPLKTRKKEKSGKCISSLSRNRRSRKSKTEESTEPDLHQGLKQTDTSLSEEIFSVGW